ncbi:endoglucanase-4 [Agrocybe pediades]|nr:endoglucanase-4 [Agrocybe pediades]
MHIGLSALVGAAAFISQVAAHGYVPLLRINGKDIPGWDISKDPYTTPQPLRVVRGTKLDSGFISDVTSTDITCSIGNQKLPPGPIQATVAAGGTVQVLWNTWPLGHFGPVLNYMAKCPTDNCSTFKGDTGSPWFKIQQDAFVNGVWASDTLARSNFTYNVHIPSKIAPGSYLLRHENLALHAASSQGGAQFYPVCIQLTVTGGGSLNPSGLSFPGTYKATDPGILFNVYQGDAVNAAYVPPGGPVYPGLN